VRSEEQMSLKRQEVEKHWHAGKPPVADYSRVDSETLHLFEGTHPKVVQQWLPAAEGIFQTNPNHRLKRRERRHRFMLRLERWFGFRFNKKHYRWVR